MQRRKLEEINIRHKQISVFGTLLTVSHSVSLAVHSLTNFLLTFHELQLTHIVS